MDEDSIKTKENDKAKKNYERGGVSKTNKPRTISPNTQKMRTIPPVNVASSCP